MKAIRILLFTVFIFTGFSLKAQEQPYVLTLDEAVNYALEHNKTLQNDKDQVKSSAHAVSAARSQGLPQVTGSVDYMTYFNYEMNFSFGSSGETPVAPDFTQSPYDLGDAATYGAIMQMLGGMTSSDPIIMDDQMSGSVQVSQLIFSGQYWAGLKLSRIAAELTKQNVTRSEQDIKQSVMDTYYTIVVLEENLKIIDENIVNIKSILSHTENMYKSGVAEATDVDQFKMTVSQLENVRKQTERGIKMSYTLLRFSMGIEPDAKITPADSYETFIGRVEPVATLDAGFDITNNINYAMMETQVKMGEKQLDVQNWAYAPTIAGYYSYTKKIMTTGFDMTPNNLAGVTATIPIFSSGYRRAQVGQAKVNLDIARRNREHVQQQLEMQKNQLLYDYQNAYENFQMQKENVAVAERLFKSMQNKYEQGVISSLDLTQSNSNLLNAKANYLTAALDLLSARTAINKLYNKI